MNISAIPVRYANAFYKLTIENGQLEPAFNDLALIYDMLTRDGKLKQFLFSPTYSKHEKKAVLKKSFIEAITPVTLQFLEYIIEKGREKFIERIFLEYKRLYFEANGFIEVKIVSAQTLTENQLHSITSQVKATFNKEPIVEAQVDETTIGGIRIVVGNKIFDHTVKNKLETIKRNLTK